MKKNRRRRRHGQTNRPFRDIQLDLTIEDVMADLDRGWSAQPTAKRKTHRAGTRAA